MRRLLPLVALAAVVAALSRWVDFSSVLTVEGLRTLVGANRPHGPLVYMAVVVAGMFLHLPQLILIGFGGVIFGRLGGFAYGWVAAVVGTTVVFLLARYLAQDWVQGRVQGRFARLDRMDDRLAQQGFRTVFLLRVFLFLAPPLSYLLATTRVRLPHYVAGTALGVVPGILVAVLGGDALSSGRLSSDTAWLLVGLAVASAIVLGLGRLLFPARV